MKINRILLIATLANVAPSTLWAQVDTASTVVIVAGQDAALAYNKGIEDVSAGKYGDASAAFSAAISISPKFAKAYYNRGVVELYGYSTASALKDFDNARAIDKNNPKYYLGASVALARLEKYDDALKRIKKAGELGCDEATLKYFYGYIYFRKGDYKTAIQQYTATVNTNPRYANAYCDRATAHLRSGNYKAALDDYATALEIMPTATFVYILRADAKASQGNYNAAIQDLNTAVNMAGDDNFTELNARGIMYGRSGKYKKAMEDFDACIALMPKNPDTYINIGNMLMSQKKYNEAELQYTKAISIDASNVAAYNNRANARELQFDLVGAQADKDRAKALLSNDK